MKVASPSLYFIYHGRHLLFAKKDNKKSLIPNMGQDWHPAVPPKLIIIIIHSSPVHTYGSCW